jgi:hypothetical protein
MKIQNPHYLTLPSAHSVLTGQPLLFSEVFFMEEIWKDVNGYEGIYSISNFGNIKSLERVTSSIRCKRVHLKERILNPVHDKLGYARVILCKCGKRKHRMVHQLVAVAFLNHTINKYTKVINHIDFNPRNNCVDNLEIVTQRENANLKQHIHSSKYTGVSYFKERKKWRAYIWINGRHNHLGLFKNEIDAHYAYEQELVKQLKN